MEDLLLDIAEKEACAVAIVDDGDLTNAGKLAAALERGGLWTALDKARADRPPHAVRIVILPELTAFAARSPAMTDPVLVEELIDLLHDRGFADAAVVGTADGSTQWAANRDLFALTDLTGYRYVTARGRPYDIIDLADQAAAVAVPADSVLQGATVSRVWLDADLRIVFSKNRTDETSGYALCLDTLIGVLPLSDKDLHYRRRRHPGDVVAALLDMAPVDFCLIDAIVSSHGAAGRRSPVAIATETVIATRDIVLADYIGALKMGLDPVVSPTYHRVARTHPLPRRYTIAGTLHPYRDWCNVPTAALRAAQYRGHSEMIDRLVTPWLQQVDQELFPLKQPVDARLNALLAEFFAGRHGDTAGQWLLALANLLIGGIGQAIESYRTLFDKDTLRQRAVPLGIDLSRVSPCAFDELVTELRQLEPIAADAPAAGDDLRWRIVDAAVVFQYVRHLPIPYAEFVRHVDVARTIQFMNDYLGGVISVVARDQAGRPIRQAERNIYLPQPNYLVLYQGKPIDVSKLEAVEYGDDGQRLYWKTVYSENGSATYDDGIAAFERMPDGTRVTITGRQLFTLPPFWQVFDLDLVPDLKAHLVTHAYRTFFDRTIANFEALVEGRPILIGRSIDEPSPPPMDQLMPLLQHLGEVALPLLRRISAPPMPTTDDGGRHVDADGFVHILPSRSASPHDAQLTDPWLADIAQFVQQLGIALQRDLTPARPFR